MAPTYRFEYASTGRAGCQNKACKDATIKIAKGEFRMGNLVETPNYTSWMWKHWGCVTPKQIASLQGLVEGLDPDDDDDMDVIDGFSELRKEEKDMIREALKCGHVADDDWRGDPELNRPGKKGINKRTPKKKADADATDGEVKEGEDASPSKKPTAKKSRAKKVKDEDEDVAEEPVPAPKKSRAKKVKKEEVESELSAEEAPAPKKSRAKKVKVEANDDEIMNDAEPAPKKKVTNGRKRKADVSDNGEEENQAVPETKKAKAPKKSAAKKVKIEEPAEEAPVNEPAAKKSKTGKGVATKEVKLENPINEEGTTDEPIAALKKKVSRGKKVKTEAEPDKVSADPDDNNDFEPVIPTGLRTEEVKDPKKPARQRNRPGKNDREIKIATDPDVVTSDAEEEERPKTTTASPDADAYVPGTHVPNYDGADSDGDGEVKGEEMKAAGKGKAKAKANTKAKVKAKGKKAGKKAA